MSMIDLVLLFFLFSFIGWAVEVLEGIIRRNEIVNRGFLIGPICPIYGFSCVLMILLLNKYEKDYVVLFFLGMILCTFIEYFTSLILEKIFNTRWWDYSDHKINLNGRVCLETMILFGIASIILMRIFKPLSYKLLDIMPYTLKIILIIILMIIILLDFILSMSVILDLKKNKLITKAQDCTKEVNKKMMEILSKKGYLTKRLIKSFPLLKGKKD